MRHQNTNSRFPVGRQQRTSVIRDFAQHKLAAKGYLIAALNDHSFCWVRPFADAQTRLETRMIVSEAAVLIMRSLNQAVERAGQKPM